MFIALCLTAMITNQTLSPSGNVKLVSVSDAVKLAVSADVTIPGSVIHTLRAYSRVSLILYFEFAKHTLNEFYLIAVFLRANRAAAHSTPPTSITGLTASEQCDSI